MYLLKELVLVTVRRNKQTHLPRGLSQLISPHCINCMPLCYSIIFTDSTLNGDQRPVPFCIRCSLLLICALHGYLSFKTMPTLYTYLLSSWLLSQSSDVSKIGIGHPLCSLHEAKISLSSFLFSFSFFPSVHPHHTSFLFSPSVFPYLFTCFFSSFLLD